MVDRWVGRIGRRLHSCGRVRIPVRTAVSPVLMSSWHAFGGAGHRTICASRRLASIDQSYTGQTPEKDLHQHGIEREIVELPRAKRGFGLLQPRQMVERFFAWTMRFRRFVKD